MGRKPKSNSLISNLKFYRQNSGFTQQQVADALHIERTTYTYYEIGKTLPNLITLKKLAQIYHVSVVSEVPVCITAGAYTYDRYLTYNFKGKE